MHEPFECLQCRAEDGELPHERSNVKGQTCMNLSNVCRAEEGELPHEGSNVKGQTCMNLSDVCNAELKTANCLMKDQM